MKITDIVTITELSNMLGRSRPTVYKYVSDYEDGNFSALPRQVRTLFDKIMDEGLSKKGAIDYCREWFARVDEDPEERTEKAAKPVRLSELVRLLKANEKRLDLRRIKEFIEGELTK